MELTKLYKVLSDLDVEEAYRIKCYNYKCDKCAAFLTQFFYDVDQRFGDCVANILYDHNGMLRKDLFLPADEDGFDYFKLIPDLVNKNDRVMLPKLDSFDNLMISTMLMTQMICIDLDEDYITRLYNDNPTSMVLPFSMAILMQDYFLERTQNYQDVYVYNSALLDFMRLLGSECFDHEQKMASHKKAIDSHRVNGKINAKHFYKEIVPQLKDSVENQENCYADTQLILGFWLANYNNNANHDEFKSITKNSIKSGFMDLIEKKLDTIVDSVDLSKFIESFCSNYNKQAFVFNKNNIIENMEDVEMKEYLKSIDDNQFKLFLKKLNDEDDYEDEEGIEDNMD